MAGTIQYIKISKIDQNGTDLTTQLESINTLTLPSGSGFAEYTIRNKTRYNDYFLYYVTPPNRVDIPDANKSNIVFSYEAPVKGQVTGMYSLVTGPFPVSLESNTPTISSEAFFIEQGTGIFENTFHSQIQTYPTESIHVSLNFTASRNLTNSETIAVALCKSSVFPTNTSTVLNTAGGLPATSSGHNTSGVTGTLSAETLLFPGEYIFAGLFKKSSSSNGLTGQLTGSLIISSSAQSGPTLQTIIEPYFTTDFYKSEYDVLQNNATKGIPNQLLQNINYNSGIIPTNIEAIMSGSAVKADIPQSNYEISSLINPSYNFSIVQSSDVNVYDPLARGTDFGDPVNIGNYGQTPSISDLDTTIYEFEWGGGTTPEILDFGAIKMGRLLSTSSPDLIKTINPSSNYKNQSLFSRTPAISQSLYNINPKYSGSTSDYYLTLNGNNPINHRINMYLYNSTAGTNPTLPSTAKILTTDFGVPTISNYMVTSSYPTIYGKWGYGKDSIEFRFKTSDIGGNDPKFSRVNTGYVPGSGVNVASGTSGTSLTGNNTIVNEITTDINNGERWFMSMYFGTLESGFDSNDLVSLDSLNSILASPTADLEDINGNFINPLTRKGVVEILGANTGSTAYTASFLINTINDYKLQIPGFGSFNYDFNFGSGSWGFLMWKARAAGKNEFVIVQDSLSGGINAGAFTSAFVPEYLTENFEAITKEYGSNQTG
tara:strand:- start:41 stop:2185 length:2145 start_codon:yes stop_codon:yes gene_type:complete